MKKTIMVTGATSGIGRAAAIHLVKRGHRVIATGRKPDALAELEKEAGSDLLSTIPLEVTSDASIAKAVELVDELTDGYGLDVLVNNAGYAEGGAVLDIPVDVVRRQFETNVFGLLAVTHAFVEKMLARGSGRIINISSVGGRIVLPMTAVYNSTKFAVECLSDGMRVECKPFGVDVVLIEPGAIKTNFNDTLKQTLGEEKVRPGRWGAASAKFDQVVDQSEGMASEPIVVAKTIAKAAEVKNPKARYVSPWRDTLTIWLVLSLPTRLWDWIRRAITGLNRPQLPS